MNLKMNSFDYQNVELRDPHFKGQREILTETYLAISNDDLLHYFREIAGIPDAAFGLAGWYGKGASTFGQILSALSHLYQTTGDARIREKALTLAEGWGDCARASDKVIDINDTYAYDKLMCGFIDLYLYLGFHEGITYCKWLTKSADRRFKRDIKRDGLQDEGLWENRMIEWYTLPEQLLRAYEITKDELFLDFAREWDYPCYYNKLANKEFSIGPRHAYSHINSLSSAACFYLLTGEEKYLKAIVNAYDYVLAKQSFATGGYGPGECLYADEPGYLGDSLKSMSDSKRIRSKYRGFGGNHFYRDDAWGSCEVSCCAWAVFKVTGYLLRITGEARFGNWAEKLLYNGTGGQPPITSEGKVMYYADYFLDGGIKTVEDRRLQESGANFEWQCCTGTFPQDVAEYVNLLYYYDDCGIYVAQYLESSVQFEVDGVKAVLDNKSSYPKRDTLNFTIKAEQPVRIKIRFRIPSWATGENALFIDGIKERKELEPDSWAELELAADPELKQIELALPFVFRLACVDEYSPDIKALSYGPITLVCNKMTNFVDVGADFHSWLEPIEKEGYSFAFRSKPGHVMGYGHLQREFYPYYEVPELRWYYMYNRFMDS